ncbi:MAG: S-methyl-5-thioribose-1-phosphate isomerase [candidate division Zixibacteria bacterium CG_4_9_14_3_um_filter_46_8]|nr:MAG: S-methyl-5-thioribose-1-phosphate isomerase [candidate division Zixibacteria bacterium CG_4_9_14_3_um_filter_46_8]
MVDIELPFKTIELRGDHLVLLDQRQLPEKVEYVQIEKYKVVIEAIRNMTVRGAPAIGVVAGFAMFLASVEYSNLPEDGYFRLMSKAADELSLARPTAANLRWAVQRIRKIIEGNHGISIAKTHQMVKQEAEAIEAEDKELCRSIGEHGAALINDGDGILTHCNAGALATAGIGTALGVIYTAAFSGKKIRIYSGETRPVDQGRRLTSWELAASGLDVTILCDNMIGSIISSGKIDKVIVGADRIAMNGDTANKIGTLNMALIADHFQVPFYVAAPYSTFDPEAQSGADIPIEFRPKDEVASAENYVDIHGKIDIYNPAFDVTPVNLITAYITDRGILTSSELGAVLMRKAKNLNQVH